MKLVTTRWQRWRWRAAERVGQGLLGGRLDELATVRFTDRMVLPPLLDCWIELARTRHDLTRPVAPREAPCTTIS